MAKYPYLPLFTDAYLGDTTHLTTIEHGAYLLLLITMWRTADKKLPDDDKKMMRFCKLTSPQWKRIKPIISEFFDIDGGFWTQGRLTDEASFIRRHSELQSNRVKARWLKTKNSSDTVVIPDVYPHTHTSLSKNLESNKPPKKDEFIRFDGRVIRLTEKDWNSWEAEFKISTNELVALLDDRDEYLARLPEEDPRRARWWLPTKKWLAKESENTARSRK